MSFTAHKVVTKAHGTAALIRPGALSLHTARHAPESTNRQLSRLRQPRVTKGGNQGGLPNHEAVEAGGESRKGSRNWSVAIKRVPSATTVFA